MRPATNSPLPDVKTAYAVTFLLVAVFAAHFLMIGEFGLYEDDFAATRYINQSSGLGDAVNAGRHDLARPVGRFIRYALNYVGAKTGALAAIYVIGFGVVAINVVLTLLVIRHIAPQGVAAAGALTYALYPADTTKILLTHSLQIQPGMTFTLLALLLYQRGRRIVPYLLCGLALLTYETTLLPFLAAPFLQPRIDRKPARRFLLHAAVITVLVVAVLVYRSSMGEARVSTFEGLTAIGLARRLAISAFEGPLTSLGLLLYRPVTAVVEGGPGTYLLMAVFAVGCFFAFRAMPCLRGHGRADLRSLTHRFNAMPLEISISGADDALGALRLLSVGVAMWPTCYLFAFSNDHWPPSATAGRMTSVHIAATFAAALTVAGAVWLACHLAHTRGKGLTAVIGAASVYFALLSGFSFVVQQDYALSWKNQRTFWRKVISLVPDLRDDQAVWITFPPPDHPAPPETKYIATKSWADYTVLSSLYDFSGKSARDYRWPRLDFITPLLMGSLERKGNRITYESATIGGGSETVEIDERNLAILYYDDDGVLRRLFGSWILGKMPLKIAPEGPPSGLRVTRVYNLIMQPAD